MKQREFIDVDTSTNATLPPRTAKRETEEAPGLPVKIPLSWLRWLLYSIAFTGPLALWYPALVGWNGLIGTCMILGHFASQLNAIINKK